MQGCCCIRFLGCRDGELLKFRCLQKEKESLKDPLVALVIEREKLIRELVKLDNLLREICYEV